MVTPFDDAGALDLDGAVDLARWLADHGSDGLVVAGTTGEGPVLSDAERVDLWRAVAEAVTVPVIAGTGTNDTAHSIELHAGWPRRGVDAVLVVTPYYNRPSQAGLSDALPGRGRRDPAPGHALRHPGARRPPDRARHHGAPGPRRGQHRGREGRGRRPGRLGPACRRGARRRSSSTAGTTP